MSGERRHGLLVWAVVLLVVAAHGGWAATGHRLPVDRIGHHLGTWGPATLVALGVLGLVANRRR